MRGDGIVPVMEVGNNNNGFGGFGNGDGAWWIIILLLFGWGRNGFGNGFGGNDGGNCYYGFGAPNIYGKLDGITYGISDATFALNNTMTNGFANVQSALCQGFAGVNNGITVNGYETRGAITDLGYRLQDCCCKTQQAIADCCCQTQRNIDNVRFENAQNTCAITNALNNSTRDILESNNNNTRAILDFLTQDKISTLTAENQALKFQASQTAQNAFITANQEAQTAELIRRLATPCPVPAYVVPNPNCCYTATYSTGCGGCGNGNGLF